MKPTSTIGTTGAAETPAEIDDVGAAATVPASQEQTGLVPRARVGRFSIVSRLGAGGMGEVYAANDPELDRLVAIKLLRPELSTRSDARLRREARAMARLSHPSLVTVHEVGVHEGQVFIAMELIRGHTLRQWARGRSWREIVRVYLSAGRGLAAAHEAGIVHRDFKPDNVLVGDDGRVAVGDFGLAQTDDAPLEGEPAMPAVDDQLTQPGALLGTPRYMAPEQLERRSADARSDQFAFCVSLWEALDAHPFHGERALDAPGRRAAMDEGPRPGGLPRRVARLLLRGLALDPAGRWPDMTTLVHRLEAAVAWRARVTVGALVVVLLGIAVAATWLIRAPAADPCATVADGIAAIWRPADGPRLAQAFGATGRAGASDAATRVTATLDRHAAEWAELRTATCVASRADDAARGELHAKQTTCLANQLHELDALVTTLLDKPTGEVVDRSIRVALELAPPADCARIGALLEQPAPARVDAARIDRLSDRIAKAKVRDALVGDATAVADLERDAEALHWPPLVADVANLAGTIAYRRGDLAAAEAALRRAALAAAQAHDDELEALATAAAARAVIEAGRAREGLEIARAAELAAIRGGDAPAVHAEVQSALGDAYRGLSQFADSDRAYGEAVATLERSGTSPFELAQTRSAWANQLFERSDYARALPLSNTAVEALRGLLGDHHPDLARALHTNGNMQLAAQAIPLAKQRFTEALAIKQAVFPANDSTIALTLHSLGNAEKAAGDLARAAELYQRALDIWLAKSGPANANVLMARYSLAVTLRHQGKFEAARAQLEDVLAQRIANPETPPARIANTLNAIAGVEGDLGHWSKAAGYAERALAIREKVLGPEAADVGDSLASLAAFHAEDHACGKTRTLAARAIAIVGKQPNGDKSETMASLLSSLGFCSKFEGKRDEALDEYHRGLAILEEPESRAELDVPLAELLWPTDRAGARAAAEDGARGLGAWGARAKAWLAAHP